MLIRLIAVAACASLAARAWSQVMDLDTYMREGGFSPRNASEGEQRRLAAIYDQGVAAHQNKQYDGAISAFTTLLQTNPEAKIAAVLYVARAQSYIGKQEFKKAVADAAQAIRFDRSLVIGYNTRGVAFARMADFRNAILDFDAALKLDPRFIAAQRNRALAERYLKAPGPEIKRTPKSPVKPKG
jgi:tetratricopeptide (TPR) repeat protein